MGNLNDEKPHLKLNLNRLFFQGFHDELFHFMPLKHRSWASYIHTKQRRTKKTTNMEEMNTKKRQRRSGKCKANEKKNRARDKERVLWIHYSIEWTQSSGPIYAWLRMCSICTWSWPESVAFSFISAHTHIHETITLWFQFNAKHGWQHGNSIAASKFGPLQPKNS